MENIAQSKSISITMQAKKTENLTGANISPYIVFWFVYANVSNLNHRKPIFCVCVSFVFLFMSVEYKKYLL